MSTRDGAFILICIAIIIFAGFTDVQGGGIAANQKMDGNTLHITGNEELLQKAEDNEWEGTGTVEDPIMIEGLSLWGDVHIFTISMTDLYVNFTNNYVQGFHHTWCSLVITMTRNVIICNNTIFGGAVGVHLMATNESLVTRNTIYDCGFDAVFMDNGCQNNVITNNHFYDNGETGVMGWTGASHNTITDNLMQGADYGVAFRMDSIANNVYNNTIERSYIAGVDLDTTDNIVESNLILKSLGDGIRVYQSNNHISENVIVQPRYRGIYIGRDGNRTEILHNTLINCTKESILIMYASRSTIRFNDFLGEADTIYAKDNGYLNVFERNYWKGFLATDQNHDGVFDTPFDITGNAQNRDQYPVASANNPIPIVHQTTDSTTTSTTSSSTFDTSSNSTATDPQPFMFLGIVLSGVVALPILVLILYYRRKT